MHNIYILITNYHTWNTPLWLELLPCFTLSSTCTSTMCMLGL